MLEIRSVWEGGSRSRPAGWGQDVLWGGKEKGGGEWVLLGEALLEQRLTCRLPFIGSFLNFPFKGWMKWACTVHSQKTESLPASPLQWKVEYISTGRWFDTWCVIIQVFEVHVWTDFEKRWVFWPPPRKSGNEAKEHCGLVGLWDVAATLLYVVSMICVCMQSSSICLLFSLLSLCRGILEPENCLLCLLGAPSPKITEARGMTSTLWRKSHPHSSCGP